VAAGQRVIFETPTGV